MAVLLAGGVMAVLLGGGIADAAGVGAVFGAGAGVCEADSSLEPLQALRASTAASDMAQIKDRRVIFFIRHLLLRGVAGAGFLALRTRFHFLTECSDSCLTVNGL